MGLTPKFRLIANNKDVTQHIDKNLISLNFHDESGTKADKIDIKVYGDFIRPKYKDKLKLYLGYKEKLEEFYCGLFIIQNTSWSKNNILTISATATDFSKNLKVLKNREFETISIKQLIEKIAKDHNLDSKCDFDDIYFPYIAQSNESDMAFLNRLAKDFNAIYSIKNNTIIFLRMDEKNTLNKVIIDSNECENLNIKNSNKTYYKSAILKYQDTKENKIKTIKIGSKEPIYNIQETFLDKKNLEQKVKAKLANLNKGIKSGSFKIYGKPIYTGSKLNFLNLKDEDNITYQIDKISHTLDGNGWNINVSFSN